MILVYNVKIHFNLSEIFITYDLRRILFTIFLLAFFFNLALTVFRRHLKYDMLHHILAFGGFN